MIEVLYIRESLLTAVGVAMLFPDEELVLTAHFYKVWLRSSCCCVAYAYEVMSATLPPSMFYPCLASTISTMLTYFDFVSDYLVGVNY